MTISQDNIKMVRFISNAIGIDPHVHAYYDENEETSFDILSVTDPTDNEVMFYSSIGISDHPNLIEMKSGEMNNISIELLITGYKDFDKVPDILSTCGFYIIKDNWTCQPYDVYKNMVDLHYPQKEVKHIMFLPPFLWEDKLTSLKLASKTVHFLLCVPITEAELAFKIRNGTSALEKLFEEQEINIFDLDRKSVV